MRSIALDVGTKTVGVAISDLSGFLASPLVTLRFESEDYDHALDQIEAILKEYPANAIILGYPKHMNGSIGDGGRRSEFFKEEIEKFTETPVLLWDERLTTVSAHKTLLQSNMRNEKRKKVVDQVAAVTMLQEYLDQQRQKEQVNGRK
ncbi:MAG TPA: Holliday junction resolvase RuvX [Erysipelotrichaceae bacterium]|nr:Holliday junction resolvase RuvX [Erysipelotrichaceae bacterium]